MASDEHNVPATLKMRETKRDDAAERSDRAARRVLNTVGSTSYTPARILWPALGFPAVIAPGGTHQALATRTICLLLVSAHKRLTKAHVAKFLRVVPWGDRHKRFLPAEPPYAFAEEHLDVRLGGLPTGDGAFAQSPGSNGPRVAPPGKGELTQIVNFAADDAGNDGVVVGLSRFVIRFCIKHGLKYLYEVRVYEHAIANLAPAAAPYHLLWVNENEKDDEEKRSAEMEVLLEYARESRFGHDGVPSLKNEPAKDRPTLERKYLLEYEYDFHKSWDGAHRTEVLHPVFVQPASPRLRIGHLTDLHVDIRTDEYYKNLWQAGQRQTAFHNWNEACKKLYRVAKGGNDVLFMTGDLVDYGRGYNESGPLGENNSYWRDRNWFLFYEMLAGGDKYQKPVYTILGNHDWRNNPYPPFTFGSPGPDDFAISKAELEVAHGAGFDKFTYATGARMVGSYLRQKLSPWRDGQLKLPGSPLETNEASVAWYLLLINPFLDFGFTLPGGYQVVMLDWANDEMVDQIQVAGGVEYNRTILVAETRGGPKAKNAITAHQRAILDAVVDRTGPKVLAIHAPPLGPWPDWPDDNLERGVVKFTPEEGEYRKGKAPSRGATRHTRTTYDRDGKEVRTEQIYEFPAKALRMSPDDPAGQEADYGSLVRGRAELVRLLRTKGFQLVLAGHIHRPNILKIDIPTVENGKISEYHGDWLIKAITPQNAPQAQQPLFINTTSAGPLGNIRKSRGNSVKARSGYTEICLLSTGKIERVRYVDDTAAGATNAPAAPAKPAKLPVPLTF